MNYSGKVAQLLYLIQYHQKLQIMSNPNKIILGLLGAAAAGIAVGILLSPDKGGEIRKKIADKAGDIASRVGELISAGKEKLGDAGSTLTSKSKNLAGEANSVAQSAT